MKTAVGLLQRISKGKVVLVFLILTNLIYGIILGYTIPQVLSFSPDSILFDMSPAGYSYQQAVDLLTLLGSEGRRTYLTVQIPLDFIYPGMFAISYALLLTWVLKQFLPLNSKLFVLSFIPVLAGIFDYLENLGIITMLKDFPEVSENIVKISSGFTIVKSGLTIIFFIILIIALVAFVIESVKKSNSAAD